MLSFEGIAWMFVDLFDGLVILFPIEKPKDLFAGIRTISNGIEYINLKSSKLLATGIEDKKCKNGDRSKSECHNWRGF